MSDLSNFDPDLFLGGQTETGFETSYERVPPGEYPAIVRGVTARKVTDREGNDSIVMDITWMVTDPEVKRITEMDEPTVRQGIFLDVNEKGGLERGKNKNVALGRVLDATGQNKGKNWSPKALEGATAVVTVEHKPNESDPENPYANVTRVRKG